MAAYVVSGAGDPEWNGLYVDAGYINFDNAYKLDDDHWLIFYPLLSVYVLTLGAQVAYIGSSAVLPANPWRVGTGTAPAPTVTLYTGGGLDMGFTFGYFQITDPQSGDTIAPGSVPVSWEAVFEAFAGPTPVPPLTISMQLYGWPVYANGAPASPTSGNVHGTLSYDEQTGNYRIAGTLDVPVVATNGTTCGIAMQCHGTVTDSASPARTWSFSGDDTETPLTLAGQPVGNPPWVRIITPANAGTVSNTAAVSIQATDDKGLVSLALSVDSVVVATQPVSGLAASWTYQWDTRLETNGLHYLTASATDSDGLTTPYTLVVTVNNGGGGGGGTGPTCAIYSPADLAGVSRTVEVDLRGTDADGTIAEAWFHIDGALVGHWTPGVSSWRQLWPWDTLGYGNGTHTLDLTVKDNSGNTATATRKTVTVGNASPGEGRLFVSERFAELPAGATPFAAQIAQQVTLGRKAQRGEVTAVIEQAALPENNCGLRFGLLSGGDWTEGVTTLDDCQSLVPDTVMAFTEPWQDARLAVEFTRLVDWTQWAIADPAVMDHQVISDTKLLLMAAGPPIVLYRWNGTDDVEVWLDLADTKWAGYAGVGFRVLGGKCYMAATTDDAMPQPVVLVQDLDGAGEPDASQQVYALEFASRNPHTLRDIEVLGQYVVVGTDDGAGHGDLWRIQADDVRFLSSAVPGARCLWVDGESLYTGGADGKVYVSGAAQFDTGEAHCNSGLVVSGKHYLCTGDGGKLYRRVGTTWELLATIPTLTEPKPLGVYYGRVWLGGNGPDLYSLDLASGTFQKYCTTGFTALTDLVGFGGRLLVFGTGAGNAFQALRVTSSHLTGYLVHELGLQVLEWS